MKKYLISTLAILCFLVGRGVVTASAQIESDVTIEANIPYTFVVKDSPLPAGKYTIRVVDDTDLKVLEIRGADGRNAVMFETVAAQADRTPRHTELVFDKIGDQYFLSQIWLSGSNSGNELEKTKAEKSLEADGMKSERHSVIARNRSSKAIKKAGKTSNSQ